MKIEYERCCCGKKAVWVYMPGYRIGVNPYSCDDCVPRGCSCNYNYTEEEFGELPPETGENITWKWVADKTWVSLDEESREYPCCEFGYDDDGYVMEEEEYDDDINA